MRPPALPLRVAHRGMPRRERENTLASFALALTEGAQGIELDVHVTSDGVVVIHHDPVTAEGRSIASSPLADLREHPDAHSMPTLGEVLRLVDGAAELFVELKGAFAETPVLHALEGYDGQAALHSFDHEMIGRASALGCAWPLGLLSEEFVADPAALLTRHGARDFWPQESLVSPDVVRRVHGIGGRVIPWTVNVPRRMRELATLGVDGICTDDVRLLAETLEKD